jgi:hypothetical protein
MKIPHVVQIATHEKAILGLKSERQGIVEHPPRSRREVFDLIEGVVDGWDRDARMRIEEHVEGARLGMDFAPFVAQIGEHALDLGPYLTYVVGKDTMRLALQKKASHLPRGMDAPDRAARIATIDAEVNRLEGEIEIERTARIAEINDSMADLADEKQRHRAES